MAFNVRDLSITLTSKEGDAWLLAHGCGHSIHIPIKTCWRTQIPCSHSPTSEDLQVLLNALQEKIKSLTEVAAVLEERERAAENK
jgi:hypothetical protein